MRREILLRALMSSAVASGFFAAPAWAQAGQETEESVDPARGDTEIVVTATRRAERIQDIPVAVTAFGDEGLRERGVKALDDYVRLVPGLSYNTTGQNISNVFIRGVTTSNAAITQSSTVAFYIDDVPIDLSYGGRSTVDLRSFDLERIEVLRGPQGTLFGSGSLSGTVRLITAKPKLNETEAIAEATVQAVEGGEVGADFNLAVNVPLVTDRLALRATGYYVTYPGYIDNIETGERNINDGYAAGGRAILRWAPTDNITADLTGIYQVSRPDNDTRTFYTPPTGRPYVYQDRIANVNTSDFWLASLTVNADLGFANLTSVTSYSDKRIDAVNDATGFSRAVATVLLGADAAPAFTVTPSTLSADTFGDVFTQEVRLASSNSGPFSWTVGGYYSDKSGGFAQALISPDFGTILPDVVPGGNLLTVVADITQVEKSVFGELSFKGIPGVEITAGGRYFDTRLTFDLVRSGTLFGLPQPVTDPQAVQQEDGLNPKFSIAFKPNSRFNIYAQAARGFRTGGFNSGVGLGTIPRFYASDSLWNYEVGVKSSFLDGQAIINIAAYQIDWDEIQVGLRQQGFSFTDNVGQARSRGLEIEATLRPAPWFAAGTAASINRAELTNDVPDLVQSSGIVGAFKGDRLPASPEFTIANYVQVEVPAGSRALTLRVDHQYIGRAYSGFGETGVRFGDYNLLGLRAGMDIGPVGVTLFVNNLLNSSKAQNALDAASVSGVVRDPALAYRLQPRTYGLTLRTAL